MSKSNESSSLHEHIVEGNREASIQHIKAELREFITERLQGTTFAQDYPVGSETVAPKGIDAFWERLAIRLEDAVKVTKAFPGDALSEELIECATEEAARLLFMSAKNGDAVAANQLMRLYEDDVKKVLKDHLRGTSYRSDDVWAYVCDRAASRFASFEYQRDGAVGAYLAVIARNFCHDLLKTMKPGREQQLLEGAGECIAGNQGSPSSAVAEQERAEALRNAIQALSSSKRMAVEMHLEGADNTEIAERLGNSAECNDDDPGKPARRRLQSAREALKKALGSRTKWFGGD